jgi:hypothetical protein
VHIVPALSGRRVSLSGMHAHDHDYRPEAIPLGYCMGREQGLSSYAVGMRSGYYIVKSALNDGSIPKTRFSGHLDRQPGAPGSR